MANKKISRRRYLVDREVQGVLISRILLHWLVAGMVCLLYLLALQMLTTSEFYTFSGHLSLFWEKYWSLTLVFVTLFPVFAYDTLKLSHRFAGPMVSFRAALRRLAAGETIRAVAFRRKDFWQEMAGQLNDIAGRLGQSNDAAEKSESE